VQAESTEFEQCRARLQAMRAVHARMQKQCTTPLSSDLLRAEIGSRLGSKGARLFHLGAASAFVEVMDRVRRYLNRATEQADEMWNMMNGSFEQLNADFGFSFVLPPLPDLERVEVDLRRIETRYGAHLNLTKAWRLAAPGAMEHFCRMLLTRLRESFETASSDLEVWSKSAENQVEVQLRERRRMFRQRSETLQRIQTATGELDARIAELEDNDQRLRALGQELDSRLAQCHGAAKEPLLLTPDLAVA
jgi:DNA repair ATPase RecN